MLGFILGSIFGGSVGVLAMCLCVAAKWGDGGEAPLTDSQVTKYEP